MPDHPHADAPPLTGDECVWLADHPDNSRADYPAGKWADPENRAPADSPQPPDPPSCVAADGLVTHATHRPMPRHFRILRYCNYARELKYLAPTEFCDTAEFIHPENATVFESVREYHRWLGSLSPETTRRIEGRVSAYTRQYLGPDAPKLRLGSEPEVPCPSTLARAVALAAGVATCGGEVG